MANPKATSALVLAALLFALVPAAAQDSGVILFTETEQVPLRTYAEFMGSGILRITHGSLEDIPTVDSLRFIRCARTGWQPAGVMAASEELFTNEYAERRLLKIAVRPVGVTAVVARVADLEDPERVAELHRAIKQPEGGDKAYFFLILTSGQVTQYYPFRMQYRAKQYASYTVAQSRMWILQSIEPEDAGLTFRLLPNTFKTMGRAPRADFVVDAALVSRVHCRFTLDNGGRLEIEDLGSTNGTFVNGKKVAKALLNDGDKLTIGRVAFVVNAATLHDSGTTKPTWTL